MKIDEVLRLLADGEIHSGEELGELLGVSRTAVWKQLQKLKAFGLQLNVVKSKGYQLENGLELIDSDWVVKNLAPSVKQYLSQLEVHGSVDSTNTLAMQRARQGDGHGYFCVAEHQTAGRGRMGRQWVSPYGRNIYLSTAWEFEGGAAQLEGLSLAMGVAIVRALQDNNIDDVQLKWPNDVLWQRQKLAGILMEMSGDPSGKCQVVVGVGLNVAMIPQEAQSIDQPWTSVAAITPSYSRNKLLASLVEKLLDVLSTFDESGFEPYRSEWESIDEFYDREVEIRVGKKILIGRAVGVESSGALRLMTAEGERFIHGGEASLRGAP